MFLALARFGDLLARLFLDIDNDAEADSIAISTNVGDVRNLNLLYPLHSNRRLLCAQLDVLVDRG